MNKRKMIGAQSAFALLALAVSQVHAATSPALDEGRVSRAEKAADKTLAKMTMEEKLAYIGGTGGWDVKPLTQYGIPQIHGADGGVGVRYTSEGNAQGVVYPSGPNLAASWNPRRAIDLGRALGYDTASGGYQFVTGPGVNLYRMPYSGRAFEYLSGEDPFLGASLAPAVINGIQSRGVWANAKHFAANDQESNRFHLNEIISERVLREMTLPPFESASKNSKVAMMMCAFQKVNGEFACQNKHLMRDILKTEWGYPGFVQSDYNAVVDGLPAAQAGTDLDMMGYQMNSTILKPYLDSGELSSATIDDKVRRILKQIYLYKFDSKAPLTSHNMNSATSNRVALNAAREGIVLLKNQNSLLPLDARKVKRIAVVGTLAKYAPPTGFGSANVMAANYISELSGLQQLAPGAKVEFIDGLSLDPATSTWTHVDGNGNSVKGLKTEFFSNTNWSRRPRRQPHRHPCRPGLVHRQPAGERRYRRHLDSLQRPDHPDGQRRAGVQGACRRRRAPLRQRQESPRQRRRQTAAEQQHSADHPGVCQGQPGSRQTGRHQAGILTPQRLPVDHGRPRRCADELGLAGGTAGPGQVRRGTGRGR